MSSLHRAVGLFLAILSMGHVARAETAFLGKAADDWLKELRDPTPAVRRGAAFALGKCAAGRTMSRLVEVLRDSDTGVREAAAYAVGEIAAENQDPTMWREAGPALCTMLAQEQDARARRSAACAIGNFGPDAADAHAELERALDHKDALVRQNAAWALGRLKDKAGASGASRLAQALSDEDVAVRRDAAAALGEVGRPTASPALRSLIACVLHEKEASVRSVAGASLVNLVGPKDRAVAADLRQLLKAEDRESRRAGAIALANLGGEDARPAVAVLLEALRDEDATARELAAAALARMGEAAPEAAAQALSEAVPALGAALSDISPLVRRNAALALTRVGSEAGRVLRPLVGALDPNQRPEVRLYAARALWRARVDTTAIAPDLLTLLKEDRDQHVRQCVVLAFGFIPARKFEELGVKKALEAVMEETSADAILVRYDAARALAHVLDDKAPPKAVDVLVTMLYDKRMQVLQGTDTTVKKGDEAAKSGTGVKDNYSGDARFMAATSLAQIAQSGKRKDALDALKKAAESSDEVTKKVAKEALKEIGQH
jgi:HEAT repeat protein